MEKPLVIITGVCGRIGSATARAFAGDCQVVGLDVVPPKEPVEGVDYRIVDISSLDAVKDCLGKIKEKYGSRIASFIHLAAYYNFAGGKWEKYQQITIEGTRNLLTGLKEMDLEQFIFSSTMLVYAPTKIGEKITEDSPVDPKWEYPLSKVKTEEIIREMAVGKSRIVLRIAGIYDDECNSIPLSQQILRIYRKELESHLFPGKLDSGSSFLHMNDLVQALRQSFDRREALEGTHFFVLGEPEILTFKQLQNQMGQLIHGKPWWTVRVPKWFAKVGATLKKSLHIGKKSFIQPWMVDLADDYYCVDISKARKELGWEPKNELKNCLSKFVSALKSNPKKWIEKHEI